MILICGIADFAIEIYRSTKFFIDYWRKKPYTRSTSGSDSPTSTVFAKEGTVGGGAYNKESTEVSRGDENDTRPFAARPPLKSDFDSAFGLSPRPGRTTAGAFSRNSVAPMNGGGNMAGVGAGAGAMGRRGDYDDVPLVANVNGGVGGRGTGSMDSSGEDVEMRPVGGNGVTGARRMR